LYIGFVLASFLLAAIALEDGVVSRVCLYSTAGYNTPTVMTLILANGTTFEYKFDVLP
jgi:hypothetical protein